MSTTNDLDPLSTWVSNTAIYKYSNVHLPVGEDGLYYLDGVVIHNPKLTADGRF